ncbi:MAG: tetratricopeptide repeat protein, partial [bacterium]
SEAVAFYYELILNYPDSEFREAAAYNRILAYDKLLENNSPLDSTTLYLSNFLGKGATQVDTINVVNHIQAQFLQASNDFSVFLVESPKLPEVLMKFAENLYKLNRFALAQAAYQKVIDHASVNGFKPQAYTMVGQCAFKQENYRDAEEWFQKLVQLYPDSTRLVERANKMLASSKFKIAENYLGQKDSTQAAVEFEKIANVVYDPEVAERALFEAAKLYENMGDKNKAIAFYEAIPKKYPHTKLFEQSLFKAGVLCEELEDWDRAAANYLALFEFDPASPFAAKSLFFAAKCYENNGNYDAARTYYGKYTTFYSEDTDRFLEAAFRKGEIAYNQKSYQTALRDLNFVIKSYQKFVQDKREVENYIPANAQFLIAEILYANFQKIKLTPPLEKKLKQKRAKFKQVIKAYTEAAKYKLAEWTTASSYKIGMTFEDFANALLESPRPRNLSGAALDEYNEKLWKSVLPLKEKALNTYQANVKQALEFNIQNKWITESKKRIEALTMELGRNTMELGQETGL